MGRPLAWHLEGQRELLSFVALTLVLTVLTSPDAILYPKRDEAIKVTNEQQLWCTSWNLACFNEGAGVPLLPCYNATALGVLLDGLPPANASTMCSDLWQAAPRTDLTDCQWSETGSNFVYGIAGFEAILGSAVYLPGLRCCRKGNKRALPYIYFGFLNVVQVAIYGALTVLVHSQGCAVPAIQVFIIGTLIALVLNMILLAANALTDGCNGWSVDDDRQTIS